MTTNHGSQKVESNVRESDFTILVVDDDSVSRRILERLLTSSGYHVLSAKDGHEALTICEKVRPHVIVCDWIMPVMDGPMLLRRLREHATLFDIYFIMLTAMEGVENIVEALESGADTFLTKPIDHRELIARVNTGLRIADLQNKLKEANARLEVLALRDGLTGLYNRRAILEIAEAEFSRDRRHDESLCFCMLDIDHFKTFNDTYGHQFGDEVLRKTADILMQTSRKSDRIGRYGGEEFCVILPQGEPDGYAYKAEMIRAAIEGMQIIESSSGEEMHITVSIGLAILDKRHNSLDDLIRDADLALYEAKNSGRNRCVVKGAPKEPE